jgi:hypothetical protein
MADHTGEQVVGEQFVRALAGKDAPTLKGLFQPGVDFRAMTPNKYFELTNHEAVVDEVMLGKWFEPEDRITDVLQVETSRVGSRDRVAYRFAVSSPDGEYVVEQQAYYETTDGRISWIRIMCAGYLPVE